MIKRIREERGMTQVQLAKKAKVAQSYIAMLESGERKGPTLPALERLARGLGVPVTALLE